MKHVHKMMFIVVVAVTALLLWPKFQRPYGWVRPMDGMYEYAEGTSSYKLSVGPTRFEIDRVIRYQENGTYHFNYLDRSSRMVSPPLNSADYSEQLKWADMTQVCLKTNPAFYDVVELRVFNHDTREMLMYEDYPGLGYSIKDSTVTICSVGKMLPDRIDLWMRVVHQGGKWVYPLKPTKGSMVSLPGNTLRIVDIAEGKYNWSGGKRTKHHDGWDGSVTSVALEFDYATGDECLLCVIDKAGNRVIPDYPHFLRGANGWQLVEVGVAMGEIDHFQISEFRGRDRFFFSGVELPMRRSGLGPMPPLRFEVHGREGEYDRRVGKMFDARLTVLADMDVSGIETLQNYGSVYKTKVSEGSTSLVCHIDGMAVKNIRFAAYDKEGEAIDCSRGKGGGVTVGDSTHYVELKVPVETVDVVEVYFEK